MIHVAFASAPFRLFGTATSPSCHVIGMPSRALWSALGRASACTSAPFRDNARARAPPTNPVAPVMNTRMPLKLILLTRTRRKALLDGGLRAHRVRGGRPRPCGQEAGTIADQPP